MHLLDSPLTLLNPIFLTSRYSSTLRELVSVFDTLHLAARDEAPTCIIVDNLCHYFAAQQQVWLVGMGCWGGEGVRVLNVCSLLLLLLHVHHCHTTSIVEISYPQSPLGTSLGSGPF